MLIQLKIENPLKKLQLRLVLRNGKNKELRCLEINSMNRPINVSP